MKIAKLFVSLVFSLLAVTTVAGTAAHFNGGDVSQYMGIGLIAYGAFVATKVTIAAVSPAARAKMLNQNTGLALFTVDLFSADLVKNLWPDGSFINNAVDESKFVTGGAVVHRPKFINRTGYKTNRSVYPANITHRSAIDITYTLDEITTDPEHITNKDINELNYDHRMEVLADHIKALNFAVPLNLLHRWNSSPDNLAYKAKQVRTTGASVASHLSGTSGNRLKLTLADVQKAKNLMNDAGIPMEGRFMYLDTYMHDQLKSDTVIANTVGGYNQTYDLKDGLLMQIEGFKIIVGSLDLAVRYDNTATPVLKDLDAVNASTDNAVAFCWQKDQVTRANGYVKAFADTDRAEYYGDICSTLARVGGRILREEGVVAIIQTAA